MKILLVHNYYGSSAPSGENMAYEAERELLRSSGHTVIEFIRHSDEIRGHGLIAAIKGAVSNIWNPFSLRRLRELIRKEEPDVMHIHNFFPLISPSAFYAADRTDTATVFTTHNYRTCCAAAIPTRLGVACTLCIDQRSVLPALFYGCYRSSRIATIPLALMIALHRWLGTWQKKIDAYISLAEFQRRLLSRAGLPEERIFVKPHFYEAPPEPVAFNKRSGNMTFIGRLSSEKGVAVLIDAWKLMGPQAPELEIIGEGPERESLQAALRGTEAERKISFSGQLSFKETQQRLANARLLIVPSICFEGFPMVIREAFALGVPVAGSRIGSIPELIADRQTGLLFEPGNASGLADAVRHAMSEPEMLAGMASSARMEFEQKYTAAANLERLMVIYNAAIDNRRLARKGLYV